ncbi:hypothetical protein TARUN_2984 [Trichoderma arundinaceum]|uniref:Uncharacterized protein n=1 Tax=Trichoderma arundinaceum TaxID=490622 RepID=A0A395NT75_TRIAR|nr:hypothetical protein TARUN_2984 [Trichoderma arundinaceum]
MRLSNLFTHSLLAALGLCGVVPREAAPPWPLNDEGGYTVEDFPFLDIVDKTALDPYMFLGKPDFGFPGVFRCLPFEEGDADPVGCSFVITKWEVWGDGDGNIVIKGGQCKAISLRCCQATVCAPKKIDVVVTPKELADLMWFKFSDKCIIQYTGAIYMDDGWDYLVMMGRPPRCQPKSYRPGAQRRSLGNESFWDQ